MKLQPFDKYAQEYDADFTFSPIGKIQRQRVYRYLMPLLKPGLKVLEVNCGTGEDALNMAPRVEEVTATDISQGMIEVAEMKRSRLKRGTLNFKIKDLRKLGQEDLQSAGLLFSNFGGLNCLSKPELKSFFEKASEYMQPGSLLVLVLLGRRCVWEDLYFVVKGDTRYKRRRTENGITSTIAGQEFNTYYYDVSQIKELLPASLELIKSRPIGFFVPPTYMNPFFKKKRFVLAGLFFLERVFAWLPLLSDYSDHNLLVLEKKR